MCMSVVRSGKGGRKWVGLVCGQHFRRGAIFLSFSPFPFLLNHVSAEEQSAAETCMTTQQYLIGFQPGVWFKTLR